MTDQSEQPGTAVALSPVQQAAVDEVGSLGKMFGMSASGAVLADVLTTTAFSGDNLPTPAQLVALVVVARQYRLNPFTKEIYAYPDKKKGIVPIVGVDGWIRIINEQPMLDGIEFNYSDETVKLNEIDPKGPEKIAHIWVECIITRKDRDKPIIIREYLDEVYKTKGNYDSPWQTHPKRFHRHKTLIQCARVAFGFAGIYDQDEADNIIEAQALEPEQRSGPARPKAKEKAKPKVEPEAKREPQEARVDERADAGARQEADPRGPNGEDIVDAEFDEVDDEAERTDDRAGPSDPVGQRDDLVGDDWEPKPGEASKGSIDFITRKGAQKNWDAIAICQHWNLNSLRGIPEAKAAEILTWLKSVEARQPEGANA